MMNSESRSSFRWMYCGLATKTVVVLATILSFTAQTASADITVLWTDDGSDLTASYSGTFDLGPYSPDHTSSVTSHNANSDTELNFANLRTTNDFYATNATSFGADKFDHSYLGTHLNSSGDDFSMLTYNGPRSQIGVPAGFTTGDSIIGSMTFAGETVSSVFGTGLSTPAVFYDDGINQVTYSTSAVPEPSAFGLILVAFGMCIATTISPASDN